MNHIVYKITIDYKDQEPKYYIGSKSNCRFVNGVILDSNGKEYWGSSRDKTFLEDMNVNSKKIDVLCVFDDYEDALTKERELHIVNDVVASTRFFNKSIATESTYSNPEYASYKHVKTGDVVRLRRNHKLVKNGTYVGVTKGVPMRDGVKEILSKKMMGERNPFYGRKHTTDTLKRITQHNTGRILSDETKKKMSVTRKGVPKSEEHRKKIGRKNLITLKNVDTGDTVRIDKSEKSLYDKEIWVNPYAYKMRFDPKVAVHCPHCNKVGNDNSTFKRWHFDNCKKRNLNEN